jgi:hypothetical protein
MRKVSRRSMWTARLVPSSLGIPSVLSGVPANYTATHILDILDSKLRAEVRDVGFRFYC